MRKLLAFSCLFAGSACLGVGGTLLAAAILPLEGIFCLMLGGLWLFLSEVLLDQTGRPVMIPVISALLASSNCISSRCSEKH